jgi:hypothetical protein
VVIGIKTRSMAMASTSGPMAVRCQKTYTHIHAKDCRLCCDCLQTQTYTHIHARPYADAYEGQWEKDLRNAEGTCTYANGDKYTGMHEFSEFCVPVLCSNGNEAAKIRNTKAYSCGTTAFSAQLEAQPGCAFAHFNTASDRQLARPFYWLFTRAVCISNCQQWQANGRMICAMDGAG